MRVELSETLFEVIGETFEKYGFQHIEGAVYSAITSENLSGFTNKGRRGREKLQLILNKCASMQHQEIRNVFLSGIIDCYASLARDNTSSELSDFLRKSERNFSNAISGKAFYPYETMSQVLNEICNHYSKETTKEKNPLLGIKNIKLHSANMQLLKDNMISGLTLINQGELHIGDMHACTSIGKKRENQEDAVLLKEHPQNKDFKLLIVSDGMGGTDSGEVVSSYTVAEISKWFEQLPFVYYKSAEMLSRKLNKELKRISNEVYEQYHGNAGATFVGGIVCEDVTVISNVGDSRAYTYTSNSNQLIQQSVDHSYVEELYKAGIIKKRDDMRFHKKSNHITQYIGVPSKIINPSTSFVPNNSYDLLLLFSDGVTDYLSDKDILIVTSRTPKSELARRIIDIAINNVSTPSAYLRKDHSYSERIGGSDNLSVALNINKKREERGDER